MMKITTLGFVIVLLFARIGHAQVPVLGILDFDLVQIKLSCSHFFLFLFFFQASVVVLVGQAQLRVWRAVSAHR